VQVENAPRILSTPGYIAVNPAVENATGLGKEPLSIPNMVMRYFVRHLEYIQVVAAPGSFKVRYLDLNKRVRVI
jgi:hypothetical protein